VRISAARREPKASPAAAPDEARARSFAAERDDQVIRQCSGRRVSAAHAPLCILAACRVGNEASARKLLGAAPASRRAELTATCKQLGVDVTTQPAARPADDCEADPMACQH
jgi:hypothetical protein